MKHIVFALSLSTALCVSAPSLADKNAPDTVEIETAISTGAFGFMALDVPETNAGDWLGQYIFVGPSWTFLFEDWFVLITGVGFEASPGPGNWGFTGSLIAEFAIPGTPVVFDISTFAIQDSAGDVHRFLWVMSTGPALIFRPSDSTSIGISLPIANGLDHTGAELGWTLNPMAFFGVTLR